jgi:hypothetical protein
VRVAGDQRDAGQAAGDEVLEEAVPARPGLRSAGGHAEDLTEPVGVDAGGDHDRDLDDPAAFADLHRERVGGHKRVRTGVEGPLAEVADQLVEIAGHHTDLGLRKPRDAQRLHEAIHPAGAHAER